MHNSNHSATRSRLISATLVFVFFAMLAATLVWRSEIARIEHERVRASDLAGEHAHAIQLNIERALSATYTLASMLQQHNGDIHDFETTASQMLSFYPGASALQLAPGGVVARIVPLAGNEGAIGHNLLKDPQRDKESFRARDTGKLTLAGPFNLVQGGLGAAGRLPVYLRDEQGQAQFWGFVIVLIRFPEALETARLARLVERGYDYELWRVHPDTGKKHVIAASTTAALAEPVNLPLQVPNATWTLSAAPAKGWDDPAALAAKIALGLFFSLFLAYYWRNFSR